MNKRYIYVINLTEQMLVFAGQPIKAEIAPLKLPREALKQLKELLEKEKGDDYEWYQPATPGNTHHHH